MKYLAMIGTVLNTVCFGLALNAGYDTFAVLGWAAATLWSLNLVVQSE